MNRITFLKKASLLTGGLVSLPLMGRNMTTGIQDAPLATDIVYFEGTDAYIKCFMARPEGAGKLPGLVIAHGNRGLNKFSMHVARTMAAQGFHVIVPDALSAKGGTLGELDENKNAIKNLNAGKNIENYRRAVQYLIRSDQTTQRVAALGHGWGGTVVNQLAIEAPSLKAAVSYYGQAPSKGLDRLKVPLQLHYAAKAESGNTGLAPFKKQLEDGGKDFELIIHPGVKQDFQNESLKLKYNRSASESAWKSTLAFLKKHTL